MLNGRMSNHLYEGWKDRTPIRAISLPSVSVHSVSVSVSASVSVSVSDGSLSSLSCRCSNRASEFDFTLQRSVYTRRYNIPDTIYRTRVYFIPPSIYRTLGSDRRIADF